MPQKSEWLLDTKEVRLKPFKVTLKLALVAALKNSVKATWLSKRYRHFSGTYILELEIVASETLSGVNLTCISILYRLEE